jgi:hypothetical protein
LQTTTFCSRFRGSVAYSGGNCFLIASVNSFCVVSFWEAR